MAGERNIAVELHRKGVILRRTSYSRVDTAIPRTTQRMMTEGKVGDLAVISHAVTGLEIGTVRMSASGRIAATYVWEEGK